MNPTTVEQHVESLLNKMYEAAASSDLAAFKEVRELRMVCERPVNSVLNRHSGT
jgi:hypothetical protein